MRKIIQSEVDYEPQTALASIQGSPFVSPHAMPQICKKKTTKKT